MNLYLRYLFPPSLAKSNHLLVYARRWAVLSLIGVVVHYTLITQGFDVDALGVVIGTAWTIAWFFVVIHVFKLMELDK